MLLYEMKFLVPNYSCLQNPWLRGYRPQIPVLSALCPQLNLLNPPSNKIPGYATDWKYLHGLWNVFLNNQCEELMPISNNLSSYGLAGAVICDWHTVDVFMVIHFYRVNLSSFLVIVFRDWGCCFLLFRAQVQSGFLWMPTGPLHGTLYIQFFT